MLVWCHEIAMSSTHVHRMKNQTYIIVSLVCLLLVVLPLSAQQEEADWANDELRYARCLDMTARAPDSAINEALIWKGEGGGVPARHCEALGLFYLGEPEEAAARLERLVDDMRVGRDMPVRLGKRLVANAPLLAQIYSQAANAWLVADEIVRAEEAIDNALSLAPEASALERELLVDRARISAADEDFESAYKDLATVKTGDPARIDILLLLASAARETGRLQEAESALVQYQQVYSDDPSGFLELGNLKNQLEDLAGARAAWLRVLLLQEEGPDADAARANIETLDVKKESD